MRIAINGLGRIGKNFLRVLLADKDVLKKITIVAINIGPAKKEYVAPLFKYDTLLGTYPGPVSLDSDRLQIDDSSIEILAHVDAKELPWKSLAIDWVVDCSGKYTHREKAEEHLRAGARKVLISAPAHGDDVTIIPGVNEKKFDSTKHSIISLGSCTTNALLPMLKVLHEAFTIEHAFMTTVHAYTNTQVLLDVANHDLRRSRAAALNIVPSTTGARESVAKVMPELKNKVEALSLRVPVDKVSLIDLVFKVQKNITQELVNNAFKKASQGALKNILECTNQELVSSDFKGNNSSVIIDETLTMVSGTMGKLFGWYDNEWGYSQRLKDFLLMCC